MKLDMCGRHREGVDMGGRHGKVDMNLIMMSRYEGSTWVIDIGKDAEMEG